MKSVIFLFVYFFVCNNLYKDQKIITVYSGIKVSFLDTLRYKIKVYYLCYETLIKWICHVISHWEEGDKITILPLKLTVPSRQTSDR